MSVERYVIAQNGQEVEQGDLTLLSDAGGLADDHVLAELLRLAPFSGNGVAKAIMPFGSAATVVPAGATGSVNVNPFRAVVGTRDTVANIGALKNWNDLRSAIFTGPNALAAQQPFQANAAAQARWDLVYAQLQVDAPGQQVSRYRKDPSTEQVTVVQVARSLVQAISVSVLASSSRSPTSASPPTLGRSAPSRQPTSRSSRPTCPWRSRRAPRSSFRPITSSKREARCSRAPASPGAWRVVGPDPSCRRR